jgi:hypothetical protein
LLHLQNIVWSSIVGDRPDRMHMQSGYIVTALCFQDSPCRAFSHKLRKANSVFQKCTVRRKII